MIDKNEVKKLYIKTGSKVRTLYTYLENSSLRKRHELYTTFLSDHFIPSTFSHAYTRKRSVFTNAKIHMYSDGFVKIDVENFFPSLNHGYLVNQLFYELNKLRHGTISKSECKQIVENCSVNRTGLPLGFLTSPILSNIYMKKFDHVLYGRLKKLGLEDVKYTRYADDIFISFKDVEPVSFGKIINICEEELKHCHLKVNRKKTRLINLNKSNHAKLAGVNIVKGDKDYRKLTVSREIIKDLYFRTMHLQEKLDGFKTEKQKLDLNKEARSIKGMQSFILSIHKKGYSHILSDNMQQSIKNYSYSSLEEMIANIPNLED